MKEPPDIEFFFEAWAHEDMGLIEINIRDVNNEFMSIITIEEAKEIGRSLSEACKQLFEENN